jgi:hypothetical protein
MPSRFPPFDNSLTEDARVVKSFVDKIQEKLDSNALTKLEPKESKILKDAIFYPGAFIGAFAGVTAFVVLRRGPILVMNTLRQRQHSNAQATGKATSSPPPMYKESPLAIAIGSIFDLAFASLIGISTWTISTNKPKALTAAASTPLIEGHSQISDVLCKDFQDIYKDIRPKFWKEYSDDTLTAIQTFVKNCEKRQLYERKLKREMGLDTGRYGAFSNETGEDLEFELPSRVPEDILDEERDRVDGKDWASVEDFEEDKFNDGRDDDQSSFWDDK